MRQLILALILIAAPILPATAGGLEAAFDVWLAGTARPAALAAGVSAATFDAATAGMKPDTTLPDLVAPGAKTGTIARDFQAEFKSPAGYLQDRRLDAAAAAAKRRLAANATTLKAVARKTGVPAAILLAVWGKESAFGKAAITKDALRTLATQAFMGSRRAEFLPEFVAALKILEGDHIARPAFKSSWAGALGQPQFMPSKFLSAAVDGDGDGRRDIWNSVPDVLASIGHFLDESGWKAGVPWGTEVRLPPAVACTLEGPDQGRPIGDWAKAGVTRADGRPVTIADVGPLGHLLMPAGRYGPAFLVSDNFYVLKAYNESDVYALWVGIVSERIARAGRLRAPWSAEGGFTRADVRRLQLRLEELGHDVGGADGLVGFRTRLALGRWQAAHGLPLTCYPDRATVAALK